MTRHRFTVRRMMSAVAIVALVLGFLVRFLGWFLDPHITVMVFNQAHFTLSDVSISYSGGDRTAARIVPGGMATADIRSQGESDMTLSYRDSKGVLRTWEGDVFIESGYRGRLEFHVRDEGVTRVDGISSDPHPPPWAFRVAPTGQMTMR